MTLYLACVAYVLSGGFSGTITLNTTTLDYPPGYLGYGTTPERKEPASQHCTAHKTFKDAALSAYRKEQLDATLTIYEVNTDTLTVRPLPRPTVRLEVEEGR